MSHEPRKSALETRPARRGLASFRSALTTFVVALSLVVQLIAMPYSQALAGPAMVSFAHSGDRRRSQGSFGDAEGPLRPYRRQGPILAAGDALPSRRPMSTVPVCR